MLKQIMPMIPAHTCYCEPFFGGGAVLLAKERSSTEVVNDINGNLVAYLNAQVEAYNGWSEKQMRQFRREVGRLKGKWIVTVDDSPLNRELFSDCHIISVSTRNRLCNGRTHSQVRFGELIICPK